MCCLHYVSEAKFRMRLVEIEQENSDLNTRVAEAEAGNTARDSEVAKLRRRLQVVEKENESLKNSNATYEHERRGLEREVPDTQDNTAPSVVCHCSVTHWNIRSSKTHLLQIMCFTVLHTEKEESLLTMSVNDEPIGSLFSVFKPTTSIVCFRYTCI